MFIDSCGTHNLIHCKVSKDLILFVYPTLEFQVMIVDGGNINCLWKFHNTNLYMGDMY